MYFTVDAAGRHRLPLYKTVLCVACALLLILNAFSLFHNLQSLKLANSQLSQSSRVADRLQYLNVLVLDAESSMRAYFVSGRESYLGPTRTVVAATEAQFRELEQLLADNPAQLKNLAQLRTLVRRRLTLMQQAIEVYRQGGLDEIVHIARVSDERSALDEIRLLVVIMVHEQNETLAARSAGFYAQYQKTVLLGIGINAIAIAVLVLFYHLVRRSFHNRAAIEQALQSANENLESMVALRTGQLSVLSRHLISVSEDEKRRLSRELHDEMGANLTSISMDLAAVTQRLRSREPELAAQLERARGTLHETVQLKRRIVEDLRPSLLDNLGLSAAIESYCAQFSRDAGVPCETDIAGHVDALAKAGDASLAIALFRIVQEALTNIRKYAGASKVSVTLRCSAETLLLRIIDDGIGIAPDTLLKPMSHGLLGMRERALLLGGLLTIRRGRNERGTCIEVRIPLRGKGAGIAAPDGAGSAAAPFGGRPGGLLSSVSSGLRRRAGGHIQSSPPYSTRPHSAPSLDDQLR